VLWFYSMGPPPASLCVSLSLALSRALSLSLYLSLALSLDVNFLPLSPSLSLSL
jgi:hypothetical protein